MPGSTKNNKNPAAKLEQTYEHKTVNISRVADPSDTAESFETRQIAPIRKPAPQRPALDLLRQPQYLPDRRPRPL